MAKNKESEATDTKFGIQYLAGQLEKEPHLVRIALRKAGIEKNEGRYSWDTQADADKIVKRLREASGGNDNREGKPATVSKATKKKAA